MPGPGCYGVAGAGRKDDEMDTVYKLASDIASVNVGDLGPTAVQEAYVFAKAMELANAILATQVENVQVRVALPRSTRIYITVLGAYSKYQGDSETGDPTELNLYPLNGHVKIEFEDDDIEIDEYKPPRFDKIPF